MKKLAIIGIALIFLLTVIGCAGKEITLNSDKVLTNTMLITRDKGAKVVYIEDFDQPYYNLTELEEFVKSNVDSFNHTNTTGNVTMDHEIKLRNGQAVMTLSFNNLDTYSAFSEDDAFLYSLEEEDASDKILVERFMSAKDGSYVTKDVALDGKKLKVLIVNEAYDVVVNGDIKYYSDNVTLVDKNKVQTPTEATSVIIYR